MVPPAFTHSYLVTDRVRVDEYGATVAPDGQNYYIAAKNTSPGVYLVDHEAYDGPTEPRVFGLPAAFADALEADLRLTPRDAGGKRQLCVYVHGLLNDWGATCAGYGAYAQNLGRAVRDEDGRTIAGFSGLVIGYSWPSTLLDMVDYGGARRRIVEGIPNFCNFVSALQEFIARRCDGRVALHVICHSEGNYLLEQVCDTLVEAGWSSPIFDQAALLAADIGAAALAEGRRPRGIATLCGRVSVYYSAHDPTLRDSQDLEFLDHEDFARLGLEGPMSPAGPLGEPRPYADVVANAVGIDCSDVVVGGNLYGTPSDDIHASYRYIPQVVSDTVAALLGVATSGRRLPVLPDTGGRGCRMPRRHDSFAG